MLTLQGPTGDEPKSRSQEQRTECSLQHYLAVTAGNQGKALRSMGQEDYLLAVAKAAEGVYFVPTLCDQHRRLENGMARKYDCLSGNGTSRSGVSKHDSPARHVRRNSSDQGDVRCAELQEPWYMHGILLSDDKLMYNPRRHYSGTASRIMAESYRYQKPMAGSNETGSPTRAWQAVYNQRPTFGRESTRGSRMYVTLPPETHRLGKAKLEPRAWLGYYVDVDAESCTESTSLTMIESFGSAWPESSRQQPPILSWRRSALIWHEGEDEELNRQMPR